MNNAEIEQIRIAQADLQVAIGWHKLNVEPVEVIQDRMYDCLNRLHDLLKDNGVIMGRHMERELQARWGKGYNGA